MKLTNKNNKFQKKNKNYFYLYSIIYNEEFILLLIYIYGIIINKYKR